MTAATVSIDLTGAELQRIIAWRRQLEREAAENRRYEGAEHHRARVDELTKIALDAGVLDAKGVAEALTPPPAARASRATRAKGGGEA